MLRAKINFRINANFLPIRAPPRDNFPFTVKKNIQNPIISKIGHHLFHQLPPYISFLDRATLWRGRKRKRKKKFLWKRERVEHLKLSREYVINGEKKERWQKRRGKGRGTIDSPVLWPTIIHGWILLTATNATGQASNLLGGSLDPATKPRRLTATTTHRRRLFECELRIATNANFKHPDVPTFSSTRSSLLTSRLRAFVHESKAFEPSLSGNYYSFTLRGCKFG